MKVLNLKVKMKRRYKNTTDSNHNLPIAPNILNRDFYASCQVQPKNVPIRRGKVHHFVIPIC
jgi:hypothetical protein